jgi:hypothetical protein
MMWSAGGVLMCVRVRGCAISFVLQLPYLCAVQPVNRAGVVREKAKWRAPPENVRVFSEMVNLNCTYAGDVRQPKKMSLLKRVLFATLIL